MRWRRNQLDAARRAERRADLLRAYLGEVDRQEQAQRARRTRVDAGAGLLIAAALALLNTARDLSRGELGIGTGGLALLALVLAISSVTPGPSREIPLQEARSKTVDSDNRITALNWLALERRLLVEARDDQISTRFGTLRVGYVALALAASVYFISLIETTQY